MIKYTKKTPIGTLEVHMEEDYACWYGMDGDYVGPCESIEEGKILCEELFDSIVSACLPGRAARELKEQMDALGLSSQKVSRYTTRYTAEDIDSFLKGDFRGFEPLTALLHLNTVITANCIR